MQCAKYCWNLSSSSGEENENGKVYDTDDNDDVNDGGQRTNYDKKAHFSL